MNCLPKFWSFDVGKHLIELLCGIAMVDLWSKGLVLLLSGGNNGFLVSERVTSLFEVFLCK